MLVFRTAPEKPRVIARSKATKQSRSGSPRFARDDTFSFCDHCNKQLNWFDNIPVISWLMLRGKSRCCHRNLSTSYPIVELVTGILFVLNYHYIGYILIFLLVYAATFDALYMYLPDWSTYTLIIIALVFGHHLYSAIGAAGFLYLIYILSKKKGMGLGDVFLAIFMGLFLGWPKIIVAFYFAFIIGAVWSVVMLILKKKKIRSEIPFGPFLILGTFIGWWWGEQIFARLF